MAQNLNDEATAEVNKTMNSDDNSNNSAKQQMEGNNQKRVHWSGIQLLEH